MCRGKMLAKIKNASVQWLISVIFIVNGFDSTTRCPSSIVKHLDLSGPGRRWSNWPRSIYSPLIIFCFKASGTLPSRAWNTLSVDVTDTESAPKWIATLPAAVDIVSDEPDDAVVVADAPDVTESDGLEAEWPPIWERAVHSVFRECLSWTAVNLCI